MKPATLPYLVMPGLDPGIHHSSQKMDCRVKYYQDALRTFARR
jgi:hypothetical protein